MVMSGKPWSRGEGGNKWVHCSAIGKVTQVKYQPCLAVIIATERHILELQRSNSKSHIFQHLDSD